MSQRMRRLVITPMRLLCLTAARIIVMGAVTLICLMVISHYLGLPVPGPSELMDKFRDLSRLADILS